MILAYSNNDGTCWLTGNTYPYKELIKSCGGIWDGKHWTIPENMVAACKAVLHKRVTIEAHCHMEQESVWATEMDIARGTVKAGCPLCDTPISCGSYVRIVREDLV